MWLEGLYCESLSMSAGRLRNMWERVCLCGVFVWLCRMVTCVDVMAAAMHRCSHQGESKQTWQQNGKKCSHHCWSTLPLHLFFFLSLLHPLFLCLLPLPGRLFFYPVCWSVSLPDILETTQQISFLCFFLFFFFPALGEDKCGYRHNVTKDHFCWQLRNSFHDCLI